MNKLIEKLAKQSGHMMPIEINGVPCLHYYADGIDWVNIESLMEKFAELIVKECAKTVNDIEYPYEDISHKDIWDTCCVWSAEKLKEHFGIKE